MSDRRFKYSQTEREHKLRLRAKELENLVKLMVHAFAKVADAKEIRISKASLLALYTYEPLSVYQDSMSGDVVICLGPQEMSSQFVKVKSFQEEEA